jgi:hypothetical protein
MNFLKEMERDAKLGVLCKEMQARMARGKGVNLKKKATECDPLEDVCLSL